MMTLHCTRNCISAGAGLLLLLAASPALADNASEVAEIRKLYAAINLDIGQARLHSLYIYTVWPDKTRRTSDKYLREMDGQEVTGVFHRDGYVAKLAVSTGVSPDGDIEDEHEYYFRPDGMLFFAFDRRYQLRGPGEEYKYEDRYYINARGRLIRTLSRTYTLGKDGKARLVDEANSPALGEDAAERFKRDFHMGIRLEDFEEYREAEKYLKR